MQHTILIRISGVSNHARKRGHHKKTTTYYTNPLLNPGYPTDYSKFTVAAANPGWGKSLNPFSNRFQYEKIKDGHFGLSRTPHAVGKHYHIFPSGAKKEPLILSKFPDTTCTPSGTPRYTTCTHKKPLSSRRSFSFSDRTAL